MKLQSNYPAYNRVNFTAMKKSQFSGIDFAVVEKFKAPIEKFDTMNDFQNWAEVKLNKMETEDLGGRDDKVANQRHRMKKIWASEITNDRTYSPSDRLLIYYGVTKDLDKKNNTYMAPYNKTVLAQTMQKLTSDLSDDKKMGFNFDKIYRTNIKNFYANDIDKNYTGWVVIPSRENDRENFRLNVMKLQSMSEKHWCTRSTHAEPYLALGDFHMYFEKGEPKIGIRFDDDVVAEFQGTLNNDRVSPEYFDVLDKYIEDNDLFLVDKAKQEYELSQKTKKVFDSAQKNISEAIKNKDYQKILQFMQIEAEKDENGKLLISHYKIPKEVNLIDLMIDEQDLLDNISGIRGDADFTRSNIEYLKNIEFIGGNANFAGTKMETLGKLKEIGGNADFEYAKIHDLGELTHIGKDLKLRYAEITDMYSLKKVDGAIHSTNFYGNSKQLEYFMTRMSD